MDWLHISQEQLVGIPVSVLLIYLSLLVLIKLNGLRSFSKMSAHDFAVTIAIGSILASSALQKEPSILQGVLAIASFLVLQSLYSLWRVKRNKPHLENQALLIMDGPKILHDNLKSAKMTEDDLIAKLREANVLDLNQVKAAVLESTGDVSILHGDADFDKGFLLKNVR